MPLYDSIDDMIFEFFPFRAPTALSPVELRHLLRITANEVLEEFLRKWRRARGDSSSPARRAIQ
ncbi:hypothetical protein BGW80DRAFT_1355897 [Lactifluus volemus]|nr:hypothetical protein BGW80DRAFT_1355897 [Lactifluus volemus]